MQIGRESFETFSQRLLALDRLAATALPTRLMQDGLAGLREIVPFDAAWWGEASGGLDGLAPRSWLSWRINLRADFAHEWNRLAHRDAFARDSLSHLGRVVQLTGYEDPDPALEAFSRKHDLYHLMAITRTLPGSGLLQYISLYRGQASQPFAPAHAVLFEQFSAHLMQRWGTRVDSLVQQGAAGRASESHALLNAVGEFAYLGARVALLLREHYPEWEGPTAPAELAAALRQARGTVRLGTRRLAVEPCGELLLMSLAPQRGPALLPPRALSVALLYAEGHTHKQIARDTGLSPATVRTYLRDAYQQLGVSDKVALGRALAGRRPRSRSR